MIEGWEHTIESRTRWEQWQRDVGDKRVIVMRVYAASPWPPDGGFRESGFKDGYDVMVNWDSIVRLPLSMSTTEALALAIAHVRLA